MFYKCATFSDVYAFLVHIHNQSLNTQRKLPDRYSLMQITCYFRMPIGLEDVSKYPYLFAELIHRGWSDTDLEKLAGLNLIRVFSQVEKVEYLLEQN